MYESRGFHRISQRDYRTYAIVLSHFTKANVSKSSNETVSAGDTVATLHTLEGAGGILGNSKLKVPPNPDQIFIFAGGGDFLAKNEQNILQAKAS